MRKAPPLVYSEKIDTKVTPEVWKQIKDLAKKEERSIASMMRVLLNEGITQRTLEPLAP